MKKKLALIFPRFRYPSGDFPLGIALLAAYVRQQRPDIAVVVCDTTFDPRMERIEAFLAEERPDVVGIGMSTLMLGEGMAAAKLVKERLGVPVFMGGPHPTVDPAGVMERSYIDAVVIGEGELATVELLDMLLAGRRGPVAGAWVRAHDGQLHTSNERRPFQKLDDLPFPAWDLIDMDAYIAAWGQLDSVRSGLRGVNLSGSRGCPYECTFCQPVLDAMFGRKLRQRSPESLVAELKALHDRYRIEGFWFTDDTFSVNRKWVTRFCEALRESGLSLRWGCTTRANLISPALMETMAAAGLAKVGIGMESANEAIREGVYKKGVPMDSIEATVWKAKELGVQVLLFLMLGAPGETRRQMVETIEAATRLPAAEASFSLFVPIPGTDLFLEMVEKGYEMSTDYTDYDYYARQPFEHELSRRELRLIQRWAYLRFYTHPYRWEAVARNAGSLNGLRSMGRKLLRILPHGAKPKQPDGDVRTANAARLVREMAAER